jgi:short-subunit dehydrogenase
VIDYRGAVDVSDKIAVLKNILITGASGGIGAALAKAYAEKGVKLFLAARNEARLAKVVEECEGRGAIVVAKLIDVTAFEELQSWIASIDQKDPIDIVFANAGVFNFVVEHMQESFLEMKETIDVNVTGLLATVSPLLQPMISRGSGSIVMVSSMAALVSLPQCPTYSASKAAAISFAQGLRRKLSKSNVRIHEVVLGYVDTAMTKEMNVGLKPFMISADKAAQTIKKKVSSGKKRIAFPWQLRCLINLTRCLPEKTLLKVFDKVYAKQGGC